MKLSEDQKSAMRMFTLFIICLLIAIISAAQTPVKVDSSGNYVTLSTKIKTVGIDTGKTFTDGKGNTYPVYKSSSGRLFVYRTSKKTGNIYKQYIQQEAK